MAYRDWSMPDEDTHGWLECECTWRYIKDADDNRLIRGIIPVLTNLKANFRNNRYRKDFVGEFNKQGSSRDTVAYWHALAKKAIVLRRKTEQDGDIMALCMITIIRFIHCALRDLILRIDCLYFDDDKVESNVKYERDEFSKALKELVTILETKVIAQKKTRRIVKGKLQDSVITWNVPQGEKGKQWVIEILDTWCELQKEMIAMLPYAWFPKDGY